MTTDEKKEAKRLYDIEYRKKNHVRLLEQYKTRYKNTPIETKKETNRKRYAALDKTLKKKQDQEYAKNNKTKLNNKKKKFNL